MYAMVVAWMVAKAEVRRAVRARNCESSIPCACGSRIEDEGPCTWVRVRVRVRVRVYG